MLVPVSLLPRCAERFVRVTAFLQVIRRLVLLLSITAMSVQSQEYADNTVSYEMQRSAEDSPLIVIRNRPATSQLQVSCSVRPVNEGAKFVGLARHGCRVHGRVNRTGLCIPHVPRPKWKLQVEHLVRLFSRRSVLSPCRRSAYTEANIFHLLTGQSPSEIADAERERAQ